MRACVLPGSFRRRSRRGAALYMTVVSTALMVSVLGLAGLAVVRVERRQADTYSDVLAAQVNARSAIELALANVVANSNWRTTYTNGVATTPLSLGAGGSGTVSWILEDSDGSLLRPDTSLQIRGIGRSGNAVWVSALRVTPQEEPYPVLGMAVHSSDELRVKSGRILDPDFAPASSNFRIKNDGIVQGSVDAVQLTGSGTVTGTVSVPADPKALPPLTVVDNYIAMAKRLNYVGDMDRKVLAPGFNNYDSSGTQADGIYYVNAGSPLTIQGSRINGTLILDVGNHWVTLGSHVFLENARSNLPALIVRGNLRLSMRSMVEANMVEALWSTNFNPPGAPYGGSSDNDQTDSYPNEIRGLVYVTGDVRIQESPRVRGCLICVGKLDVDDPCSMIHTASLLTTPPIGFSTTTLNALPGSWYRAAAP